jgi:hypothetical protein
VYGMLDKIDLDLKFNDPATKVFVTLLDFHGCSGKDQISPKQQICFLKIMYYSIFFYYDSQVLHRSSSEARG